VLLYVRVVSHKLDVGGTVCPTKIKNHLKKGLIHRFIVY